MWARCVSTVRMLRSSCSPISRLVWPSAISRSTSVSRGESGWLSPFSLLFAKPAATAARKVLATLRGGPNRLDQLQVRGVLEEVAECPVIERPPSQSQVALHRQQDDLGRGGALAQVRHHVYREAVRQVDVEYENPWPVGSDDLLHRSEVLGFPHHLEPQLRVKKSAQGTPDDRMIVGQDDRDRPRSSWLLTHRRA